MTRSVSSLCGKPDSRSVFVKELLLGIGTWTVHTLSAAAELSWPHRGCFAHRVDRFHYFIQHVCWRLFCLLTGLSAHSITESWAPWWACVPPLVCMCAAAVVRSCAQNCCVFLQHWLPDRPRDGFYFQHVFLGVQSVFYNHHVGRPFLVGESLVLEALPFTQGI